MTAFYGLLYWRRATFTYANAGDNPPIWLRARSGRAYYLNLPGIALGVIPEVNLREETIALGAGDVLVLYTDGVTEAMTDLEEEFGVPRLEQARSRESDALGP